MSEGFILVVEDEPLLLETFCFVLEEAGYAVKCVESATLAERVLEDDGEAVKALITDISLGRGKTGWDLALRAREIRPDLPVLYLTGYGGTSPSRQQVSGSEVIPKPMLPAQLVEQVNRMIGAGYPPK